MFFNFLKKPIVLDFYTQRADVFNYAPIDKASVFLPNWWKQIPKNFSLPDKIHSLPTMKTCSGFTDLYKKGVIVPMWCDFAIEVGGIGSDGYTYQYSDRMSKLEVHGQHQRGSAFPVTKYQHTKLEIPWCVECKDDIDFIFTPATWNFETPEEIVVPTGILNFKYQFGLNINIFWPRQNEIKIHNIAFGQPLAQIIPLSDRPLVIKHHLISNEEYVQKNSISAVTSFSNKYKKNKRILKEKGCPFHHKVEK